VNSKNLIDELNKIFEDKRDFDKFFEVILGKIPEYIRLNPLKIQKEKLLKNLREKGFLLKENEFFPEAIQVIEKKFEISKTIEHFLGYFYIQSLSSMIPVKLLEINEDDKVLDICAAPGSKTTQAGIYLKNKGIIFSNDINIERLRALSHNVDRIGLLNCSINRIDGEKIGDIFFEEFDKVIVDPPCSSIGIVDKYPSIIKWWHPREIDKFYKVQREILKSAIKSLKPNGKLVYSTCTLSVKENEYLIDEMLKKYPVQVCEIKNLNISVRKGFRKFENFEFEKEIEKTIRIYPQDVLSEGFYIAVLSKKDSMKREEKFYLKDDRKFVDFENNEIKEAFNYLEQEFGLEKKFFEEFLFYLKKDEIWILSKKFKEIVNPFDLRRGMRFLRKHFKGYKLTTNFVQIFGHLFKNRILKIEEFEDAKKFCEGKDVKISSPFKGQVIVFYKDYPIGTGFFEGDILKSQIPRSRRIFEIEG
jgi:16S rRNA (cytosine1407-C5)-methyltransferase